MSNIIWNCKNEEGDKNDEEDEVDEKMVFIGYRGKVLDSFESSLKKLKVPCKIIFTSKKLKMDLPSLKPPVEKCLKSRVVYKICCSRCQSCYVGQTIRHLITRLKDTKDLALWEIILRSVVSSCQLRTCQFFVLLLVQHFI